MTNAKPTLLFVCVHNAGRSQLAAGLAALRGADQVTVLSAGLDPDEKVSEVALASLADAGIDRSDQTPTKLTDKIISTSLVELGQANGSVAPAPRFGSALLHVRGRPEHLRAPRKGPLLLSQHCLVYASQFRVT
jgi:hypothetical protein